MSASHPSSRKIYLPGSRPDLRVPMREVCLHGGEPPVRLYDTGGPWTDPDAHPDIKMGLSALRLPWIVSRGDVEELPGPTSAYRRQRDGCLTLPTGVAKRGCSLASAWSSRSRTPSNRTR